MMCTQKSSAKRRLRAIALLPALGAAVSVADLPAVASVISEASCAELFSPAADMTAGTAKESTTTQPGIEPTVVKINGKSGAAGTAELPANTIVKVNGEVIPTEQYKSIPSSSIASMNIDKRDDHAVINITTK